MRAATVLERIVDRQSRRNFFAFLGDYSLFGTALAFVSTSTVLPSLMRALSASSPVIGLMETIHTGAWLLPQLFVARALSGRHLRKRAMMVPLLFGRLTYPLFILLILLLSARNPGLTAGLLLAGFAFFFFCDACGSIPWFDLFSILLSPK